jgi:FtsZ-binding cell division protein ZapB
MGINFAVPSDSADAAKRRLLESGIESVHALKDFIVEYDRMKEERDQLKREITDSLEELEMLRKQVQQLKIQRDQFSSTLSTLISQMEPLCGRHNTLSTLTSQMEIVVGSQRSKTLRKKANFKRPLNLFRAPPLHRPIQCQRPGGRTLRRQRPRHPLIPRRFP